MDTLKKLLSFFVAFVVVTATSSLASKNDVDVLKVTGKPGGAAVAVYAGVGSTVQLICETGINEEDNKTSPYWFFRGDRTYSDVENLCKSPNFTQIATTKEDDPPASDRRTKSFMDCNVKVDDSNFILELKNIIKLEFGQYVCSRDNNVTFYLEEIVALTRRARHGKIKQSVTLYEGNVLKLYCNVTGFNSKWHTVSWWKDGNQNITDELNNAKGHFENFKRIDDFTYTGISNYTLHRGNYTCQVDLKNQGNGTETPGADNYPVKFTFFVRVKENNWKFPTYILLGEIILITLFTLIVNKLEKRSEEEPDGQYEDSDDDDEIQAAKSRNGAQNNNSNGNGNGK